MKKIIKTISTHLKEVAIILRPIENIKLIIWTYNIRKKLAKSSL